MSEHFLYDTWISVKGVSKVKLFPKGFPSRKHLLEAKCKNTRVISWILCWICSKLPIKTSERRPCKLRTRIPSNIYLSKVNYRRTRKKYEISSKLTIKTTEGRQWRRSGVFIVNFEQISHLFLVLLLMKLNEQLLAWIWQVGLLSKSHRRTCKYGSQ